MDNEAVLAELRAIRDLLIMTGGEEVDGLLDDLDKEHISLLRELKTGDWVESRDVIPPLAEEFDVSSRTMQRKKDDLLELKFIEQRGERRGAEYRKTGLGHVAQRSGEL